jgi:D-alanyl-lipoteichoic acid acyltransferase DltB (MBOAT superfamily)
LCNIRLPANFCSPYQAVNIQDFWRRWHITLSRWLRDYLYIPLGGNRHGAWHGALALLLTFALGGLWHGANWTFVLWGGLHGIGTIVHKGWRAAGLHMPVLVSWLLTFLFVNAAWVFFRANSLTDAVSILHSMAGLHGYASGSELTALAANVVEPSTWNPLAESSSGRQAILLIAGLAIVWLCPDSHALSQKRLLASGSGLSVLLTGLLAGIAMFYTFFLATGIKPFIYFYF